MDTTRVRFDQVGKRFRLGETHDSLRDLLTGLLGRLSGKKRTAVEKSFWALEDLCFEVRAGEALGIIGPNGAGKSTVLKLLAGILRADRGRVDVHGRLAPLIEVGAGFHGDLTGRENIFLNGSILGMSRAEIRSKFSAIVEFAGVHRFLDMPIKRYSSGMHARLGFAIAAYVDPDILLVDEVLSVGDAVFRLRCLARMHELVRRGTTLVFVTHNLDQMREICGRALVLEQGRCVFHGPSSDAVGKYMNAVSRAFSVRPADLGAEDSGDNPTIELQGLRLLNETDDDVLWIQPRESICVELTVQLHRPVPRLIVELNLRTSFGEQLLSLNSGRDQQTFQGRVGTNTIRLNMADLPIAGGQYYWNARIWDADRGTVELDTPFRFPMTIADDGPATGMVSVGHTWSFAPAPTSVALELHENKPSASCAIGDEHERLPLR